MPELSGFELLRELQDAPLVVFTTAYDGYSRRFGRLFGEAGRKALDEVWGVDVLASLLAGAVPRAAKIRLDIHVLGFAAATSLIAGLSFGLAPAWNAASRQLKVPLQRSGSDVSRGVRGKRLSSRCGFRIPSAFSPST